MNMEDRYYLNHQLWQTTFSSLVYAKVKLENNTLVVVMKCEEKNPKAIYTKRNEPVYEDSCMEFFVKFDKNDENYFNFEMNANGALLCQYGKNRHERQFIECSLVEVQVLQTKNDWQVTLKIPETFIKQYNQSFLSSVLCNFYKCGDKTSQPHYFSWAKILEEKPNFHCPKYFKEIKLY